MKKYTEYINNIRSSRENKYFEYSERHHIIPRCLGGTDDEDNLIYLTYREHFIAHKLLYEENPENEKLFYAYWRMCNGRNKVVTSEEYEGARRVFRESQLGENNPAKKESVRLKMSESKKLKYAGQGNPFYGKNHTEESRKKMSEKHSGVVLTEEHRRKISESISGESNPFYGKKHTEESRKKISVNHADFSGENHPMYGKHHTEETREKMRHRKFNLICKSCSTSFIGTSGNQKFCDICKNIVNN